VVDCSLEDGARQRGLTAAADGLFGQRLPKTTTI